MMSTIHAAAQRGDLESVRRFIEVDGVHVDCRDGEGRTPLCVAVDGGGRSRVLMQPLVRYLISKHANVEARDSTGWTALLNAMFFGYTEAATILLKEGGANANSCNMSGRSPFNTALRCSMGHRTIPTLLRYGAEIETVEYRGGTVLHVIERDAEAFGAISNHCRGMMTEHDFCKLLLQTKMGNNNIALHTTESVDIAKLLIEQPRRQDDNQLLSACRAQLVSKNGRGQTPKEEIMATQVASIGRRDLLVYLESYESVAVSIPGVAHASSNDAPKRRRKVLLNGCIAVKLNPQLNGFQQSVAQEAFDLIMEATECPDSIGYAVLGYLSLMDVMKRNN